MKKVSQKLLSDNLCEYIRICVRREYLEFMLTISRHDGNLPIKLELKFFENSILEFNHRLFEISEIKQIERTHDFDWDATNEKISEMVLYFHSGVFGKDMEIYNEYLKYNINDKDLENDSDVINNVFNNKKNESLPTYKTLTDYKLMIEYFARILWLKKSISDFKESEKGNYKFLENFKQNKLKTNINDIQRGKLFDLLVLHDFIPDKDKEGFIWAFGGLNDNYTSYSTEWLKNKNLAVYFIDTLCIDNGRLWAIGSRIFGINNMAQIKQGYFSINKTGKPKGYKLIDTIISEAQK